MDEAKIQSGGKSKCCNANTILHVTTGTHAAGTRVCGRCGKVVPPSPTPTLTLEEELKEHTDTTVQEAMYVLRKRGAFKTAQEVDDFFKSTLEMSLHERDTIHAKHYTKAQQRIKELEGEKISVRNNIQEFWNHLDSIGMKVSGSDMSKAEALGFNKAADTIRTLFESLLQKHTS